MFKFLKVLNQLKDQKYIIAFEGFRSLKNIVNLSYNITDSLIIMILEYAIFKQNDILSYYCIGILLNFGTNEYQQISI